MSPYLIIYFFVTVHGGNPSRARKQAETPNRGDNTYLEKSMAIQRGGVRLAISDACLGLVGALEEVFPRAAWQRCTVHFYRNMLAKVPTRLLHDLHKQMTLPLLLHSFRGITRVLRNLQQEGDGDCLSRGPGAGWKNKGNAPKRG